jgi:hypothetical protein
MDKAIFYLGILLSTVMAIPAMAGEIVRYEQSHYKQIITPHFEDGIFKDQGFISEAQPQAPLPAPTSKLVALSTLKAQHPMSKMPDKGH